MCLSLRSCPGIKFILLWPPLWACYCLRQHILDCLNNQVDLHIGATMEII
jgi:hypothetical protein